MVPSYVLFTTRNGKKSETLIAVGNKTRAKRMLAEISLFPLFFLPPPRPICEPKYYGRVLAWVIKPLQLELTK